MTNTEGTEEKLIPTETCTISTVITKEKSTLKADSTTNTAITKEGESRNNPFSIAHKTIYRNYSGLRINQITDNKI